MINYGKYLDSLKQYLVCDTNLKGLISLLYFNSLNPDSCFFWLNEIVKVNHLQNVSFGQNYKGIPIEFDKEKAKEFFLSFDYEFKFIDSQNLKNHNWIFKSQYASTLSELQENWDGNTFQYSSDFKDKIDHLFFGSLAGCERRIYRGKKRFVRKFSSKYSFFFDENVHNKIFNDPIHFTFYDVYLYDNKSNRKVEKIMENYDTGLFFFVGASAFMSNFMYYNLYDSNGDTTEGKLITNEPGIYYHEDSNLYELTNSREFVLLCNKFLHMHIDLFIRFLYNLESCIE